MRIFVVRSLDEPYNILRFSPFKNIEEAVAARFALQVLPDTAWQQRSRPLFVPDYAPAGLLLTLAYAVRISRLGRSVAADYAARYYDAATLCAAASAPELAATLQQCQLPTDAAYGFDAAVNGGTWEAIPADSLPLRLQLSGAVQTECMAATPARAQVDTALAFVSQYVKLCQGDVLLLPIAPLDVRATEGTHIEGFFGAKPILSYNIK